MRRRSPLLAAALAGLVVAAALGALGWARPKPAAGPPGGADRIPAELAAVRKTRDLLEDKLAARGEDLRTRVRALYKLSRGGLAPLWVDERARADLVQRRAAARRTILRDLAEHKLLQGELAATAAAERRLGVEAALAAAAAAPPLAPDSLRRPVRGYVSLHYGIGRDAATRARVFRRGVELANPAGDRVHAPLPGRVLYAGPVRGLGVGVILDHGQGTTTVLGGLARAAVAAGAGVERGDVVGEALGPRVYLEVRRGGRPVDPEPLLGASR